MFFSGWAVKPEFFNIAWPDKARASLDVIVWSLGLVRLNAFLKRFPAKRFNSLLIVASQEKFHATYLMNFLKAFHVAPEKELRRFYRKMCWSRPHYLDKLRPYLYLSSDVDYSLLESELKRLTSIELDLDNISSRFNKILVVALNKDLIVPAENVFALASKLKAPCISIDEPHFCFFSDKIKPVLFSMDEFLVK